VVERLGRIPGYASFFTAAFPDEPNPSKAENIAKAIGAFERTLLTPSPFDAYLAGGTDALTPMARAGLKKFINTSCIACHQGVGVSGSAFRKFGVVEDY
jgi:cytochrome c peroxidase